METLGLGFRPPQFSEDLAWAPAWLQQHRIEQLNDSHFECEDVRVYPQRNGNGGYADSLSREDEVNESYRLFFSGEETTPSEFVSSPGNVLHLHLRLSSTGFSQCSPTQPADESENNVISNRVESVGPSHTSVGLKEESSSEMELNCGGNFLVPLENSQKSIKDVGSVCPSSEKISAICVRENYNFKHLKGTDINAAAELSIAASEALVIYEIARHETFTDALPTETVIESALWLKKARLEWSVEESDILADETDENENDSLSDLDDVIMSDAYEDVGLFHCNPVDDFICGSAVSVVRETPLSELEHECVNIYGPIELRAEHLKSDDMSVQGKLSEKMVIDGSKNNVPVESNHDSDEFQNNLVPGINICNMASDGDSALKNSNILMKKQKIGPSMADVTSYHPQEELNLRSCSRDSASAREDMIINLVPDSFRSRWLGGWTGQDASAVGHIVHNNKIVGKYFAAETSFLSESADIAPDMNSIVQVHETESLRITQSSIHLNLWPSKCNQGTLHSQDVVKSSSLSLVDSLCSVVPCSFPSENEVPMSGQTEKDIENNKFSSPTTELVTWNSHQHSNPGLKFQHEDDQATSAVSGEDSLATVRRHFISLKTYSTILPNNGGNLGQLSKLDCAGRLITLDPNVSCIKSYGGKASLPIKHISEHLSARNNMVDGKLISNSTPYQRKYHESTGHENEIALQASKRRRRFVSFKHRAHNYLQASRSFLNNQTCVRQPKLGLAVDNDVELQRNKELHSISSEQGLHGRDVSGKKRVHFSEAEIIVERMKNLKSCIETDRASKKPKYSSNSKFHIRDKHWRTNSHAKAEKRLLFSGMKFLLTGFSRQKAKDLEGQIWKHGGIVLFDIPSPNSRANKSLRSNVYQLPIILCPKKLQTTTFLYGCAVNAFILKDRWFTESISVRHVVPHEQYAILPSMAAAEQSSVGKPLWYKRDYVFDRVGIMLLGKQSFCGKFGKIVEHGGGQVFKTLQRLLLDLGKEKISCGAIVSEDEKTSRHLRHCATEQRIPIVPASWIIKSLHLGKCLSFPDTGNSSSSGTISGPLSAG